jgi:hypothetical protein
VPVLPPTSVPRVLSVILFSCQLGCWIPALFRARVVTLTLSEHSKQFYDLVVGSFGAHDSDLEPILLSTLEKCMDEKLNALKELRARIKWE